MLAIVVGVLALSALIARLFISAKIGTVATFATLSLSLIAAASMAYTANLGGQIRHSEIRQNQSSPQSSEAKPTKKEDDDDH